MTYPKVLIIGQVIDKKNGSGITLSNLFKGWPKDKLAVATSIYLNNDLDFSICETYYQLGYNNKQHPFPLNIFHPKIRCGIIDKNRSIKQNTQNAKPRKSFGLSKIHAFLDSLLTFFGIYNFFYKLKITEPFNKWLIEYNPDVIYSQLSSLELIRFVNLLQETTKKPLVIHIMDDWPAKINQSGLFNSYWKKRIDKEFRSLLDKSSALLSISNAMSKEYKIRYNKNFIPFHNPVEIDNWLPFAKTRWDTNEIFTILYTGRIGTANGKSIMMMANVIDTINSKKIKMKLDIFTPGVHSENAILINNFKGVEVKNTMPHSAMPGLLASYDLLFLPLDFDNEAIIFSQYSMPTKVSEYMISGTPILVFADKRTALAKYALNDTWAMVVTENKKSTLAEALNELMTNEEFRMKLGTRAKEVAIKNENAEIVRTNFKKVLSQM